MRFIFCKILIVFLFIGPLANAQGFISEKKDSLDVGENIATGQIKIFQDSRIDTIIKKHIEYNRQQNGIEGYRVQVFFDAGNNSLNRATNVAEQFQLLFPGDTAYISFSEPYYKVRVGDFRTRLDAEGYLQQILPDYPNAFVIRDKINFPGFD